MRLYAGIGSRSTPAEELPILTKIAAFLEEAGYILRSGGAEGADKAFEAGISRPSQKEIFRIKDCTPEAEKIARKVHPMWSACNEHARKLHGRNAQIILGKNLDTPVEFVLAWTWDGKERGGTRTGLVLAQNRGIPTFNLADPEERAKFVGLLLKIRKEYALAKASETGDAGRSSRIG